MGSSLRDTGMEYLRVLRGAASSLVGAAFSRGKDDEGKGPEHLLVDLFAPRSVAGARRKVFIQSSVGVLGLLMLIVVFSRPSAPAKTMAGVVSHLEVASDIPDKTEILMEEERRLREAMEQGEGTSSPKELIPKAGLGAGEQEDQKPAAAEETLAGASSQMQQAAAQLQGEDKAATEEGDKGPKGPADALGEDKAEEKEEEKAGEKEEEGAGEKAGGEGPELKAAAKEEDGEEEKAEETVEKKGEEKAEDKEEGRLEEASSPGKEASKEASKGEGKEEEEDEEDKAADSRPQVLASEKAGAEDSKRSGKGAGAEKEEDDEKDEESSAKPVSGKPVEASKTEPARATPGVEAEPAQARSAQGKSAEAQGKYKGSGRESGSVSGGGGGEEDDYEGEKGDGKEEPAADSVEDSDDDKVEAGANGGAGGEEKEEVLRISDFIKDDTAGAAAAEGGSGAGGASSAALDDVTIGNLTKDEDSEKGVAEEVRELESASAGVVVPSAEAKIVAATAEAVASDPIEYVDPSACQGRTVYIYPLPARFNRALVEQCQTLLPWYNMCPHFLNHGLGKIIRSSSFMRPSARWFETHSYSLEMVFHYRLRRSYKCITADPAAADLYYVPFYASLDVMRWHFRKDATLEATNHLSHSLVRWLAKHDSFKKNNGSDHVIVLGKVTWDFRRHGKSTWGNDFLLQPEMKQVTRLLLEADEWDTSDVAVPHLTYFHPRQENDLGVWQREVKNHARNILVSFAALRGMYRNLKEAVGKQCKDDPRNCRFVNCVEDICSSPEATVGLYMDSHFCMVPPGYESVRRAPFDAMLAGCIPVFFDHFFLKQYKWHLPSDPSLYAVHFNGDDVLSGKVNVIKELKSYSMRRIRKLRKAMIHTVLPGLLYNHPKAKPMEDHEDAFDITLRKLFERIGDRRTRTSAVQ